MARIDTLPSIVAHEGETAQIRTAIQSWNSEGTLSLERSLADRVLAGEIQIEDARAFANDLESLALHAGKA